MEWLDSFREGCRAALQAELVPTRLETLSQHIVEDSRDEMSDSMQSMQSVESRSTDSSASTVSMLSSENSLQLEMGQHAAPRDKSCIRPKAPETPRSRSLAVFGIPHLEGLLVPSEQDMKDAERWKSRIQKLRRFLAWDDIPLSFFVDEIVADVDLDSDDEEEDDDDEEEKEEEEKVTCLQVLEDLFAPFFFE
ncbi:Hypothetical Protein FCC1311_105322 [Hondaea fermentalgiana]|uniref:Uncharacterized protein n=1 Tax=Hondaea fermentalgiana TaxID=2315210 RepID=A0A2R5GVF7_9STRA|nr:Hypothetical Protein FCC1311_105322 [Hondaea fermentalgiana]|eukprot:GBG34309.1 Hypothetical Protein FCC1311_105322 [Hondaea fermentalgiana]